MRALPVIWKRTRTVYVTMCPRCTVNVPKVNLALFCAGITFSLRMQNTQATARPVGRDYVYRLPPRVAPVPAGQLAQKLREVARCAGDRRSSLRLRQDEVAAQRRGRVQCQLQKLDFFRVPARTRSLSVLFQACWRLR